MSRLDTFVAPRPKPWMLRATSVLNRVAMLRGVPRLRDLRPFSSIPGIRAIADVREIDLPAADEARLSALCGPGRATFIAPNHPEFFTDWMIDKELLWRVAPLAASWATHGVVNGMGGLMQRFWLANNLIAQIPGNSEAAKRFSVEWAAKGHAVLLHPEGAVGWHNDYVAPLMPGAVEMAADALALGRAANPAFRSFVAPVVWKLVFLRDAEAGLRKEARYVERRLGIEAPSSPDATSAERIFRIYDTLVRREAADFGLAMAGAVRLRKVHAILVRAAADALARSIDARGRADVDEVQRLARHWLREKKDGEPDHLRKVKDLAAALARIRRLGAFAFERPTITQEQIAEHLKRIRNDYCKGTLRDTLSAFMPRPVAPRRAVVRVPEPLEIKSGDIDVERETRILRQRLQNALDAINAELRAAGAFRTLPNPFHDA